MVVIDLLPFSREHDRLSHKKNRIGTEIPAPNDDTTILIDAKMMTETMFGDTRLDGS